MSFRGNTRILLPPAVEKMNESIAAIAFEKYDYKTNPGDARYFGVFIGFLVVFLGVAGNGVTVWAYARNKTLQTSFNVLIANLCLVDLIFSVIVISLTLPGYVVGENIYSKFSCSMIGYFYYVSLTSSLYNLVAIAVNRYVGIVQSQHYQKLFTGQRLAFCIASVWLVPALLYLPVVIGGAIKWTSNTLRCAIGGELPPSIKWYNLSLDITFQAIPLVVLIILYTAIFKKVKQVKEKMKCHQQLPKTSSKIRQISTASSSTKNKSGNTSDDTGDEFKPSSLLEGITLKPVNSGSIERNLNENSLLASNNQEETEDEGEKSTEDALKESLTPSNDESINATLTVCNEPKKRNSIWGMLLRHNPKLKNFQKSSDTSNTPTQKSEEEPVISENTALKRASNSESEEKKTRKLEIRRKKSLSTPNLPTNTAQFLCLDTFENNSMSNMNHQITNSSKMKTLEVPKQNSLSSQLTRSKSVCERSPTGEFPNEENDDSSKTSVAWSLRIKRTTKDLMGNWGMSGGDSNSLPGRVRFGTIARKVQDRKAREAEKRRKRERKRRILRKKHARERQLVYSSFTICIAFALCIMPTAILYLVQVFSHTMAPASANLIVGCIAWLHSVVNPIIYGYLNAQYRKEYSKIAAAISRRLTCNRLTSQRWR